MRLVLLLVACTVLGGCATSEPSDGGRPSGADARGQRGAAPRAPGSPSPTAAPTTTGARYALRIDAARAAIRDGEGRKALAAYQRLAAELEAKGAKSDAALAHSLASMAAVSVGGFQQGIHSGLRALELLKGESLTGAGVQAMVLAYNQVAFAYRRAGDLKGAERYLQEGLTAVGQSKSPPFPFFAAGFLRNLGSVALAEGRRADALRYAEESVSTIEEVISNHPRMPIDGRVAARYHLGGGLMLLGRARLNVGDLAGAEFALKQALNYAEAEMEAEALTGLGSVALARNDYAGALTSLGQALAKASRIDAVSVMITLHQLIGRSHAGQGRLDEALAAVRRSIQLVEDVRSQLQESGLRSGFLEDKQAIYEQAVDLALATENAEEAFRFAEGSRARAFLDLLGNQTTLSKGKTRQLVDEEVRLKARLAAAHAQAEEATNDANRARARREAEAAERDYRAFLERVRKENLEQASLMTVEPATIPDVQALLPAGTTLLEYMVAEREAIVWVIDAQRTKVLRLPVARAPLVSQVREFRSAIAEQAPLEEIQERSRKLYGALLVAVRPEIRGDRLLIVPHDVLHYLPFAALSTTEGRWLVDEYALGTLPSASVLKFLAGKGERAPDRVLAVGNPDLGPGLALRYAEREARLVGQRYPGTTVLVRRQATEARVKALAAESGLIHFATHGDLSESDPLGSALLLVPEGGEDGRLEVRELFGLELNARLVVLSACETGLGKLSRGDELVGLQRAFLYAGTPAVITTLWKVDDRASFLLMRTFYERLPTLGPARALREAQRAATKEFPHPFAWAAFGLTGSPR